MTGSKGDQVPRSENLRDSIGVFLDLDVAIVLEREKNRIAQAETDRVVLHVGLEVGGAGSFLARTRGVRRSR